MAVPTNTVQTFSMVGIREDLSDVISNISPEQTPFYSMTMKGKTGSRTPEWEFEGLKAPDPTNANIEGDDATNDALGQPTRIKNVVQLMDKVIQVSSTADAVNTAGKTSETAHQKMLRVKELKRDIEMRMCGNFASVVGAAGTAGEMGGAEAYIETNVSLDATSGAVGGYNSGTGVIDAATDSSATQALAEPLLKTVLREAWENGGSPSMVMANGTSKQTISGFGGIATQYRENTGNSQATILGAADVYISDFGTHSIVPNRFLGAGTGRTPISGSLEGLYAGRTVLVLTPSTWETKFLQPFKTESLAKTGHSNRTMLSAELTLCCKNERANGKIADLT